MGKILLFSITSLMFICCFSVNGKHLVRQNGENLLLHCTLDNGLIKWKVNGVEKVQTGSSSVGNVVNSTFNVANVTADNAGLYQCFDSMDLRTSLQNFNVAIISISGQNSSIPDNSTVAVLKCDVNHANNINTPRLSWKRLGKNITEGGFNYTVKTVNSSTELEIKSPQVEDAGLYTCVVNFENEDTVFKHSFSLNVPPVVKKIGKVRSKVEGETATIVCEVSGFPTPTITWQFIKEDSTDVKEVRSSDTGVTINTTTADDNISTSVLKITDLTIEDHRGDYRCVATNYLDSSNSTVTLKVKDKLAAVWPFLGICCEVLILCSIIFIFEKRRNRRMEEEEEVDAVKQELMNQPNGTDDKEIRQRSVATKA